jgi:hypothetical protein
MTSPSVFGGEKTAAGNFQGKILAGWSLRFYCLKLLHDYPKRAGDCSLIGAQLSHFGNDGAHHLEQGIWFT